MRWNWEKENWPNFNYDSKVLDPYEQEFLYKAGIFYGSFEHLDDDTQLNLKINLICDEALKTSQIEGENLNRDSLQSSIRKNFGLQVDKRRIPLAEQGIANLMLDLYKNFADDLSHQSLFNWNSMIVNGFSDLDEPWYYRRHEDPMQVVSGPIHNPKIHFEAPQSAEVPKEMERFIKWFNITRPNSDKALSPLIRAGLTHLYFVSIHPFEDGNGRMARALAEKSLSQNLGKATLIALSISIEKHRKKYYDALEFSNKDLEVTDWLKYFALTVLEAQDYSQKLIEFLIKKSRFYEENRSKLNSRQEKVIARIFQEGLDGFKGGLSAENYIAISKTSRATATRDLQDLVDKRILRREGQLKSSRYYITYM